RDGQTARRLREHAGRRSHAAAGVVAQALEAAIDGVDERGSSHHPARRQQRDVAAQAGLGGRATGRPVWSPQEAHALERRELLPQRGRRPAKAVVPDQRSRGHRLAGHDEVAAHGAQDLLLAFAQGHGLERLGLLGRLRHRPATLTPSAAPCTPWPVRSFRISSDFARLGWPEIWPEIWPEVWPEVWPTTWPRDLAQDEGASSLRKGSRWSAPRRARAGRCRSRRAIASAPERPAGSP